MRLAPTLAFALLAACALPDARTLAHRGMSAYHDGRLQDAIAHCDWAIRSDPVYGPAFVWRGLARLALGDVAGGLFDLDEGIARHPPPDPDATLLAALEGKSRAYEARGDWPGAMREAERIIHLAPGEVLGYVRRANLLRSKGQYEEAITEYSHAIEIQKTWDIYVFGMADPYYGRGQARLRTGDRDGAISDFERFLLMAKELGPSDPRIVGDPRVSEVSLRVAELRGRR